MTWSVLSSTRRREPPGGLRPGSGLRGGSATAAVPLTALAAFDPDAEPRLLHLEGGQAPLGDEVDQFLDFLE